MASNQKSPSEALTAIASILNKTCGTEQSLVTKDAKLIDDLNVDSLGMLEAVIEAEDHFEVSIDAGELSPTMSVGELLELLRQKGAISDAHD